MGKRDFGMDVWRVAIAGCWVSCTAVCTVRLVRRVRRTPADSLDGPVARALRTFSQPLLGWTEMLAVYGAVQTPRFVLLQPDWTRRIMGDASLLTALQVLFLVAGTAMYYVLAQLGARHWARPDAPGDPDCTRPTALRKTLVRVEMRTLLGLTLFATLADVVFVAHRAGTPLGVRPMVAPASLREQANHIAGVERIDFLGDLIGGRARIGAAALESDATLSEKGRDSAGEERQPREDVPPRSAVEDPIRGDGERTRSSASGSVPRAYDVLFDEVPVAAVRLAVALGCAATTVLQMRQVRFFLHTLARSASPKTTPRPTPPGKLARYRCIMGYHAAALLVALASAALALWTLSVETRRVVAMGRGGTRGGGPRPPAAPEWPGVTAPSAEDQALMLGSYVFWTACSLLDLL